MNPLYGLILCGGQSSRMGEDKSLLDYHGKPQRYFMYDMLEPFCEKVFISCNHEQAKEIPPLYKLIRDKKIFADIGPMAALLSAFEKFPSVSFLVIGCDYPFLTVKNIRDLIHERTEKADAVCYRHPETDFHEPLICIYENNSREKLLTRFKEKKYSLQQFLKEANTCNVIPSSVNFLTSVNTQEGYRKTKELLSAKLF
jgi:molybdopterin-guanine dinucleotide biosynthesis protein A